MKSLLTSILLGLITLSVGARAIAEDSVQWHKILMGVPYPSSEEPPVYKLVVDNDTLYMVELVNVGDDVVSNAVLKSEDGRVWESVEGMEIEYDSSSSISTEDMWAEIIKVFEDGTSGVIDENALTWENIAPTLHDSYIWDFLLYYDNSYLQKYISTDIINFKGCVFLLLYHINQIDLPVPLVYYTYLNKEDEVDVDYFNINKSSSEGDTLQLDWASTGDADYYIIATFDGYDMLDPVITRLDANTNILEIESPTLGSIYGIAAEKADGSVGPWRIARGNLDHAKWHWGILGNVDEQTRPGVIQIRYNTPSCIAGVGLWGYKCDYEWDYFYRNSVANQISSFVSHIYLGADVYTAAYPWLYSYLYGYTWPLTEENEKYTDFAYSMDFGWLYFEPTRAPFVFQFDTGLWLWKYRYRTEHFDYNFRGHDHYIYKTHELLYRQTAEGDGWELVAQYDED